MVGWRKPEPAKRFQVATRPRMAVIGLAYQERCPTSTQEKEEWKRYEVKGIRDKVAPREDLPI
jgi:hypothetical protein